jgi:hypothetical protein
LVSLVSISELWLGKVAAAAVLDSIFRREWLPWRAIVHASHFIEALLQVTSRGCHPACLGARGECHGRLLPAAMIIPEDFFYRLLDRDEVCRLEAALSATGGSLCPGARQG